MRADDERIGRERRELSLRFIEPSEHGETERAARGEHAIVDRFRTRCLRAARPFVACFEVADRFREKRAGR